MAGDDITAILAQLAAHPEDAELRQRAAEALDAGGRRDEATAILAPLINVTGHDDDTGLPCLCRACLPQAGATAEASEMQFRRSFAVAGRRVLHFWALAELDRDRRNVRVTVAAALAGRLAASKPK